MPSKIVVAMLLAVFAHAAAGQSGYPRKPILMLVPLQAASAVDNAARIVAQKMADNMGQSIVVENQPGAAGLIGAERVAKAAPDGYTIGGFNDSIMTMLPNVHLKMPWDILRDFEPVSQVASMEWVLVAPAGTPKDIVARLNAEVVKAVSAPEVREKLVAQGFTVVASSPDELQKNTKEQLERYAKLFKQVGIKAE